MASASLTFEQMMRRGGQAALSEASRFFMREDRVHTALREITAKLRELDIPYAVAGGMSLVAHGYDRTTQDVDILLTREGLQKAHDLLDGLGYVPPFAGSKNLRHVSTGVRIEFLLTGDYPGDGKPKPVSFPNPADVRTEIDGIQYLQLPKVIELKLASGISASHRLKDLADVQELIRTLSLDASLAEQLNPYVRAKYLELLDAVKNAPADEL